MMTLLFSLLLCQAFTVTVKAQGSNVCGNTTLSSPSGNITSPNYPNKYDVNLDCNYTITTSRENTVKLTFDLMDTEKFYDWVTISCVSGNLVESPAFSGQDQPPEIWIHSCNLISVFFHSNMQIVRKGFSLHYTTVSGITTGGFSIRPSNVVLEDDGSKSAKFNCTSSSGRLPWWTRIGIFNATQYVDTIMTTADCRVAENMLNYEWLQTETVGSDFCNLIILPEKVGYFEGVFVCMDSTLATASAALITFKTEMKNPQFTDIVLGDQLNISASVMLESDPFTLHPYTFLFYRFGTSFSKKAAFRFTIKGFDWYSQNGNIVRNVSNFNTSYIIVNVLSTMLPSYTWTVTMSIDSLISDGATNQPGIWSRSTQAGPVLYRPEEDGVNITGDANGQIQSGSKLMCYVPANPPATYSWLDESSRVFYYKSNITVTHSGRYTCNASNVIRGQINEVRKSITVEISNSPPVSPSPYVATLITGVVLGVSFLIALIVAIVLAVCLCRKNQTPIDTYEMPDRNYAQINRSHYADQRQDQRDTEMNPNYLQIANRGTLEAPKNNGNGSVYSD